MTNLTVGKRVMKIEWENMMDNEKFDHLFEFERELQDYLDYWISDFERRMIIIKQRMKVLEKAQDKLFKLICYSKT